MLIRIMRLASRADRQRPPARLNDAQGKSTERMQEQQQ